MIEEGGAEWSFSNPPVTEMIMRIRISAATATPAIVTSFNVLLNEVAP
jgi:hypothetical protein